MVDFASGQLIGLTPVLELDDADRHSRGQRRCDRRGSVTTGVIAVEHQQDAIEVDTEEIGLIR